MASSLILMPASCGQAKAPAKVEAFVVYGEIIHTDYGKIFPAPVLSIFLGLCIKFRFLAQVCLVFYRYTVDVQSNKIIRLEDKLGHL